MGHVIPMPPASRTAPRELAPPKGRTRSGRRRLPDRRDRGRVQRRARDPASAVALRRNDRVYLVERAPRLGQGLAYATGNPRHLLNVRIENMSAFADEPDHFVRWLAALPEAERQAAGERSFAGTFVRRQVYGAYIQHLLEDSITRLGGGRNLHLVPDEATALRPLEDGLLLETAGGRPYRVDAAVLALGNFPPDQRPDARLFGDPWHRDAVRDLDRGGRCC